MSNYHVKFRVHYVGGTAEEFDELISEQKYHWYSDGSQGSSRLATMAEQRDYRGRKVNYVTMSVIKGTSIN